MTITLREDPAVTELRRIVESELPIATKFIYANLFEANFGLDQLSQSEEFPVFLFIANDKSTNRLTETGLIVRDVSVTGMLLNSIPANETMDFKTEDVSPYIEQMRQLGDSLIYQINKSSMTYPTSPILNYTFDKVYAKFDAHLFGVGMTFTWSINTYSRGC